MKPSSVARTAACLKNVLGVVEDTVDTAIRVLVGLAGPKSVAVRNAKQLEWLQQLQHLLLQLW